MGKGISKNVSLKKFWQDLEISGVFFISRSLVFARFGFTFLSLETFYQGVSDSDFLLQYWTKVLGTVLQYSYFYVISRLPLKTVHHFRNFQQFPLPPPCTKLKLGKNSGYTRPTLFVGWGEGLDLYELQNAPEMQSDVRLLSMIVGSRRLGNSRIFRFATTYIIYIWQVHLFDSARGGHFIKAVRCHTNK